MHALVIGCDGSSNNACPNLLHDKTIESFLHSRLLIQLLCDHYISMHRNNKSTGAITADANIEGVIEDATTEARHVCISFSNEGDDYKPPPLVRSWLHHAIVGITKNAMTSNVQHFSSILMPQNNNDIQSMPPNARLHFPVSGISFLGPCFSFLSRIPQDSCGFLFFPEEFFYGNLILAGRRNPESPEYSGITVPANENYRDLNARPGSERRWRGDGPYHGL